MDVLCVSLASPDVVYTRGVYAPKVIRWGILYSVLSLSLNANSCHCVSCSTTHNVQHRDLRART